MIAAASYSARSLRLTRGSQAMRSMPGWRSNSRALKVSNSLRVISSLVDSNSVRSATSRLMYSLMPFCMTIDFGLGRVLELDLVDAVFPSRHRGGAREREQKADANRDERRTIEPEQRRSAPPSGHTPPILIVLIATAHSKSARPLVAATELLVEPPERLSDKDRG